MPMQYQPISCRSSICYSCCVRTDVVITGSPLRFLYRRNLRRDDSSPITFAQALTTHYYSEYQFTACFLVPEGRGRLSPEKKGTGVKGPDSSFDPKTKLGLSVQ